MRFTSACLATLLLFSTPAQSSTVQQLTFNEVAKMADGVVSGTVSQVQSARGDGGLIYTFVSLEKLEIIRGAYDSDRFTLRIEGGEIDGEVLEVTGAPRFRPGERVIVFVDGNGERIVPIAGWTQGLFRIVRDPESGSDFVVDAVGNRIYGFKDGDVVKEQRIGSDVEFHGGTTAGSAQSEKPEIDFGQFNGGRQILDEDQQGAISPDINFQTVVGDVLNYDRFKQQLAVQMDAAGVGDLEPMKSVEPGALPTVETGDGVAQATPQPDSPPAQIPSDRGEIPRPIDEGNRANPEDKR